jgi:CRISPR-associated protein Cas2
MDDHIFLVAYDISDEKRWRQIWRIMKGHGEWIQYSVFQCRLSRRRHAELIAKLDETIHHTEDHVIIIDLGRSEQVTLQVISLGKEFQVVKSGPKIV